MVSNINMSIACIVFSLMAFSSLVEGGLRSDVFSKFSDESIKGSRHNNGTKWAVLVAGSNNFGNYRHQADICHAYHIMKKGGLKDEHIIVFMYDDIAYSKYNPVRGVIINSPHGKNVYPGVPKDYTGKQVNAKNLYAVLLGNKKAVKGGSGKVLNSGPNDHVFIYYADHGGPGILGMPEGEEYIYAKDLIDVFKKKHAAKSYKSMVVYVEACESGSIFDGLLPKNMNIYVTTAATPTESSWACYCNMTGTPKQFSNICLGDVYSVSWMEDSDKSDPSKETLEQQYVVVKNRTASADEGTSSHVMQYGDLSLTRQHRALYMGATSRKGRDTEPKPTTFSAIEQREADLFHLKQRVKSFREGSDEWNDAQSQLDEAISHRKHVDYAVEKIGEDLFGSVYGDILPKVRPAGQPVVDDWDCFKAMVKIYEQHCGSLKDYGKKYMRAFANICNAGIQRDRMTLAANEICGSEHKWNSPNNSNT